MNVLHIESRRSRKYNSEFDIYVDVELGSDVTTESIMADLARGVKNFVHHSSSGKLYMNKTTSLDLGNTKCKS